MTKGERRRYEFRNWKQNKGLSDYKFYSSHYGQLTVVHKDSELARSMEDNAHELKSVHKVTARKRVPCVLHGLDAVRWSQGEKFDSLEHMIETLFIIKLAEL